jgi:hypothetical protein
MIKYLSLNSKFWEKLLSLIKFSLRFTIKSDWYSRPIDALGVPKEKKMDCIFNTYTGKTFIFNNNFFWDQRSVYTDQKHTE